MLDLTPILHMKNANIELHAHPFMPKTDFDMIPFEMDDAKVDVLALSYLDRAVYPYLLETFKQDKCYDYTWIASKKDPSFKLPMAKLSDDPAGFRIKLGHHETSKILLHAREYSTKENFHILAVGNIIEDVAPATEIRKLIDENLKRDALVVITHPFVDLGKTKTAGHISESQEKELEKICKEYSGQICLEWNGYCIPWVRRGLKLGLNLFGQSTDYHDVNEKVLDFYFRQAAKGINTPVVASTDLHAKNRNQLAHMGTARIVMDLDTDCASSVVSSMKKNIFSLNYKNVYENVSLGHLLDAYSVPLLKSLFRNK